MDVTHYPPFDRLCYIHVCIDTYSHMIYASARTGEAFKDVQQHMMSAFAYMGQPQAIKTDNGPAYTSRAFKHFCEMFSIKHTTGIPYNPQGQAIVERANLTLKTHLTKLKESDIDHKSSHHILSHCLFVLNHLNLNSEGFSAAQRHWNPDGSLTRPLVMWKDQLTGTWKGPDILLTSGRGYACVFPQDSDSPIWIPDRLIRSDGKKITTPSPEESFLPDASPV